MRRDVLICLLLAGITLVLYWPATHCDFLNYDDPTYVTENAQVQKGLTLENVAWAFSHPVSGNWHPLTMLSLMLDCQLFGLQPWGYHLTNLLIHTLNTVLVFLLLRGLTRLRSDATARQAGLRTEASPPSTLNPLARQSEAKTAQPLGASKRSEDGSTAPWRSAAVAALFGWHPLHVESVAWIAERKDVLSGMFFMLTLLAYASYAKRKTRLRDDETTDYGTTEDETTRLRTTGLRTKAEAGDRRAEDETTRQQDNETTGLRTRAERGGRKSEVGDQRPEVRSPWSVVRSPSALFYLLSLACFALGLMSKAMLVTLPFVLLLLDYWPLQRFTIYDLRFTISPPAPGSGATSVLRSPLSALRSPLFQRLAMEKLPFFALAAAACVVTYAVQNQGGAVDSFDRLPLDARVGNALISYGRYLGKILWPTDLVIFYPHPRYWPWETVLLAGAFLGGVSALFFARRNRQPWLLMGWLWFLGTLVPVIGLVQVGAQAMAERYTYLPSLGVFVLIVWGAAGIWGATEGNEGNEGKNARIRTLIRSSRREEAPFEIRKVRASSRRLLQGSSWLVGSASLILCCLVTRQQLGYWRNSETLFRHALAVTTNNWLAGDNLGCALLEQGRNAEAIGYLEQSVRLRPTAFKTHANLAHALLAMGRVDESLFHSQAAVRLQPDFAPAHFLLGNALFKQGRVNEAIGQYQTYVRLEPGAANGHVNLGMALMNRGRPDEAIGEYRAALRLNPAIAEVHNNLGIALLGKGQTEEAITESQEAIRLKPDYAPAHLNLGDALCKQGRLDPAIAQFQEAVRLKPDDPGAQRELAGALEFKRQSSSSVQAPDPGELNNEAWALATSPDAKIRDGTRAVKLAEQACQQTQYQQTIMVGTLAAAYAEAGRFDDAMATAQKACALAASHGETNLLGRNQELLELYKTRQPYHEAR